MKRFESYKLYTIKVRKSRRKGERFSLDPVKLLELETNYQDPATRYIIWKLTKQILTIFDHDNSWQKKIYLDFHTQLLSLESLISLHIKVKLRQEFKMVQEFLEEKKVIVDFKN